MSQSLLDLHLRSVIKRSEVPKAVAKRVSNSSETKKKRKAPSDFTDINKNSKARNYLDDARKSMHNNRQRVDNIIKVLGEKLSKKFSKRRLKSLIKIQRTKT